MLEVVVIAAMSENGVIGLAGRLPWTIKEDMRHFKELTMGYPCIMGRTTYLSLPRRPLAGRLNIVLTRGGSIREDGVTTCSTLHEALRRCEPYGKTFICGGETVYKEAIDLANRIELTIVHATIAGDRYFPSIDAAKWEEEAREDFPEISFVTYRSRLR